MKINWTVLIAAVIICNLAGIIGSFFTFSAIPGWYATLVKPELSPPNWVFGPVWTTLYTFMGIAAYLVWEKGINKKDVKTALGVFGIQLVLNSIWSIIFFGMNMIFYAFIEIIFLWVAIAASIVLFYRIDKRAAYLLIPYIVWVSFAAFLNYNLWILN